METIQKSTFLSDCLKTKLANYYISVVTLKGVYTIQQTSSINTCILNTFAGSLLDVCWIM